MDQKLPLRLMAAAVRLRRRELSRALQAIATALPEYGRVDSTVSTSDMMELLLTASTKRMRYQEIYTAFCSERELERERIQRAKDQFIRELNPIDLRHWLRHPNDDEDRATADRLGLSLAEYRRMLLQADRLHHIER